MDLAQKLKNARISRKISQKTLADALTVSRSTLSAWESGKAVPPVQYLRKYQELFDFEKGYFEGLSVPKKTSESLAFDVSGLNREGIAALEDFYASLLSDEEYLKKS